MVAASVEQDKLAIMERLNRYGWGYDANDRAMLRDCFTSDATFAIHLAGTDGWGPYRGRDLIVDWMFAAREMQSDQRRHCVTNFLFDELTDSRAAVRCFLTVTAAERGKVRLVTTGTYQIEAARERESWRIRKLDVFLDAPY